MLSNYVLRSLLAAMNPNQILTQSELGVKTGQKVDEEPLAPRCSRIRLPESAQGLGGDGLCLLGSKNQVPLFYLGEHRGSLLELPRQEPF